MPRFFVSPFSGDFVVIKGADAAHIRRSLRMRVGDSLTVCDGSGTDYSCIIDSFEDDNVMLHITKHHASYSEPSINVTLFQALPKGDKMEFIIQKAVELGVNRIVPFISSRCIAKLDGDRADKKLSRWQKISDEAASQCGRGILPEVGGVCSFTDILNQISAIDNSIVMYEGGGLPLSALVEPEISEAALIIGCEGGFSPEEINMLENSGASRSTLGPRILRCETAPIAALSVIMSLTGNMEV